MVRAVRWASLVWAVLLSSCGPSYDSVVRAVPAEHSRASIFDAPWVWADEEGRVVTTAQWRGSPLVVAMIYSTCLRTCPRTVEKLRSIDASLRSRGRSAQFLLVTLDPDVDTTERLRNYKAAHKLPGSWRLLRGQARSTRALADLVEIHVMDMGPHIVHESKIAAFDARGMLARSIECCDFDDRAVVDFDDPGTR